MTLGSGSEKSLTNKSSLNMGISCSHTFHHCEKLMGYQKYKILWFGPQTFETTTFVALPYISQFTSSLTPAVLRPDLSVCFLF